MELFNKRNERFWEETLDTSIDDLLKYFLGRVLREKIKYDNFKVISLQTSDSPLSETINHYSMDDLDEELLFVVNRTYTVFETQFEGVEYLFTSLKYYKHPDEYPDDYLRRRHFIQGIIKVQIKEAKGRKIGNVNALIDFLNKEVISNSFFNKQLLKYNYNWMGLIGSFAYMKPHPTNIENIFLPNLIKRQISRFVDSLLNYNEIGVSLRYLFNGEPGTGKTQLINAILNEINGKVTTFVVSETDFPVKKIFELAEMFKPCLLILDDLDLILQERDSSSLIEKCNLSTFLQYLDGLLPKSVFLLATTNDKTLVDKAASRPGRFDLIIDVGEIKPQNYFDLINRETNDNDILEFFTESVLSNLADKKITGAFLVNLIKQFKNIKLTSGKISSDEMKEYLDFSFRGFYKTNIPQTASGFGFGVKSNEKLVLNKND